MLRFAVAALFGAFASTAVAAATVPAVAIQPAAACEPGKLGAPPCEVEGDVTELAAELLVVKFGAGAPGFAGERVTRYAAEDDAQSSKFWQSVADRATEILKSRSN